MGLRVCIHCARGGCAFYFRKRGAPTYRALASVLAFCFPSQWGCGSSGLCRPLERSEGSQQTIRPSHPVRVACRDGPRSRRWAAVPPVSLKSWVWVPHYNGLTPVLCDFRPRIPGGFTLPHRPVKTLGRGPRSDPRAPMQMVSGALGSLGFRV